MIKVSILIRNLNEAESLKICLPSLQMQQTSFETEIVFLDNESTDNSVEIAKSYGCKVHTLPRKDFTFGHALNKGIEHCQGEIILTISSHTALLGKYFIEEMMAYFANEKVAGLRFSASTCQQRLIHELKANKITKQDLEANTPPVLANHWGHYIVCNCAAIRKSCWQIQPFDEKIIASEDKLWSIEILKKGFVIVYQVPCYYVYFKNWNRQQFLKKFLIEGIAQHQITGKKPQGFGGLILSSCKKILGETKKAVVENYYTIRNNAKLYWALKKMREKK